MLSRKLNPAVNIQMNFDRIKWILEVIYRVFWVFAITRCHKARIRLTHNYPPHILGASQWKF